jgi:uncharacterized protein YndB with AHSA1/START domain
MQPAPYPAPNPMWMTVLGWIISALAGLALIASGVGKLMAYKPEGAPDTGWSDSVMLGLGIVEAGGALLYLFPRTSVIGAIVLTGYLGGAVATHLRIADAFVIPIVFGALLWLGLNLRDQRLRCVLPWRGDPAVPPAGGFVPAFGKFVLTLVVLVAVIAALIVAHPADYRLTRTVTIDAPPAKVFAHVNDFHKWEAWSPWLEAEPEAKGTYEGTASGTGAVYKWSGEKLGEGGMTITESVPNERIKIKLEFVRPLPDTAEVVISLKADGDKTVVTWTMTGENGLRNKALHSLVSMELVVGGMFDKGLKNLKGIVEGKK